MAGSSKRPSRCQAAMPESVTGGGAAPLCTPPIGCRPIAQANLDSAGSVSLRFKYMRVVARSAAVPARLALPQTPDARQRCRRPRRVTQRPPVTLPADRVGGRRVDPRCGSKGAARSQEVCGVPGSRPSAKRETPAPFQERQARAHLRTGSLACLRLHSHRHENPNRRLHFHKYTLRAGRRPTSVDRPGVRLLQGPLRAPVFLADPACAITL